jgi:prolyl oligopeptidase
MGLLHEGIALIHGSLVVLLVAGTAFPPMLTGQSLEYPAADRDEVVDDYHGTRVADPYRWLEQLDSARTVDWLKAENRVTSAYLAKIRDRAAIHRRLTSLWSYARTEVPWREGGRIFYLRNTGLQAQAVLYMQTDLGSTPRVALDPNRISPDGSIAVRDYAASPDGRFLAYNTSRGGADVADTHIRQLSSGRDLHEVVSGVLNNVCWTKDGRGFFYVRPGPRNPEKPGNGSRAATQVAYHVLGKPREQDRLVVEWEEARWVYCMLGEDGRYALFVAEQGTRNEIYAQDLEDPQRPEVTNPAFELLANRKGLQTPIGIVGNTLFLRTDFQAPKGCVIALGLREAAGATPRPVIPEAADVIESATIAGDRIVAALPGGRKEPPAAF